MTMYDDILAIKTTVATIQADVEALKAAPAGTVDLTPIETSLAAISTDTTAIKAEVTATPVPQQ